MSSWPSRIRVGHRRIDTWRAMAVGGTIAGTAWFAGLTAAQGGPVGIAVAMVPLLLLGFVGASLVRRAITGRETVVLLEHLYLAVGLVGGAAVLIGQPVLVWLDRFVPALAVLMAFGRVGCRAAGCCYGQRTSWALDPWGGDRVPTQLLEVVTWTGLALGGSVVALVGPPGAATRAVLVTYAVVRFGLEGVRGDVRPHLLGISESRWLSVGLLGIAVALDPAPGWSALAVVSAGAFAAVGLLLTRRWWLANVVPERPQLADWARSLLSDPPAGDDVRSLAFDDHSVVASQRAGALVVSVRPLGPRTGVDELVEELIEVLGPARPHRSVTPSGLTLLHFGDPPPADEVLVEPEPVPSPAPAPSPRRAPLAGHKKDEGYFESA